MTDSSLSTRNELWPFSLFCPAEFHESPSRQSAAVATVWQREEVGTHLRPGELRSRFGPPLQPNPERLSMHAAYRDWARHPLQLPWWLLTLKKMLPTPLAAPVPSFLSSVEALQKHGHPLNNVQNDVTLRRGQRSTETEVKAKLSNVIFFSTAASPNMSEWISAVLWPASVLWKGYFRAPVYRKETNNLIKGLYYLALVVALVDVVLFSPLVWK